MDFATSPLIAALLGIAMVIIAVSIHHEGLTFVSQRFLASVKTPRRWHVSASVALLISVHVLEILACAAIFYLAAEKLNIGALQGDAVTNLSTYIYYSFASYTSLGIGDLYPSGHLRVLTGIEALIGLLMIGWTASFILLEMRQFWSIDKPK